MPGNQKQNLELIRKCKLNTIGNKTGKDPLDKLNSSNRDSSRVEDEIFNVEGLGVDSARMEVEIFNDEGSS